MLCCEVCNSKVASLYCKADSARLCLLCDHDIHSANALSMRHTRSQICNRCRIEAASSVCLSHNISLCQRCDRESHSHCLTNRAPIQGFMGCPSAMELATLLGYDLGAENFTLLNSAGPSSILDDDHNKLIDLHDDLNVAPHKNKDGVYEQLVEMKMRVATTHGVDIEDAASVSELITPINSTPLLMFPTKQLENVSSKNNQPVNDQTRTTPASEMHLNSNEPRLEMEGRRSTLKSNSQGSASQ